MLQAQAFSPTQPVIAPPVVMPQQGDLLPDLVAKLIHVEAGGSGAEVVADTAAKTFATLRFLVITAATFSSVTPAAGFTATGLTGVAFPVGSVLPFRLTAFTLTSGSVLAIKA